MLPHLFNTNVLTVPYMHTFIHTYIHIYIYSQVQKTRAKHMYTQYHICTHTYTHIYTHRYKRRGLFGLLADLHHSCTKNSSYTQYHICIHTYTHILTGTKGEGYLDCSLTFITPVQRILAPRSWLTPHHNFDTFPIALLSLSRVVTLNWMAVWYAGMDGVAPGIQVCVYVCVCVLFRMNACTIVVIPGRHAKLDGGMVCGYGWGRPSNSGMCVCVCVCLVSYECMYYCRYPGSSR